MDEGVEQGLCGLWGINLYRGQGCELEAGLVLVHRFAEDGELGVEGVRADVVFKIELDRDRMGLRLRLRLRLRLVMSDVFAEHGGLRVEGA
jgi:hypothetical protein